MSAADQSWLDLWAALAAAARGAVLPAPTSVHEVRRLAEERGASGLLSLGLGEPPAFHPASTPGAHAPMDTLRHVHGALEAARIPHVFFKGPFADALLWGGQGIRAGNDVDVLIAPDDESGALAALGPAFTQAQSHGLDATAALSKARRLLPLAPGLCELDLHLRPLNDPPFRASSREVLASARVWNSALGPLPGPDPAHMLVWSAGNLAGGRLQGLLRQAADAARLVHLHPVDWALVVTTARAWRAGAATWGFLRLLEEQLGAPIPASTLEALAPPVPVGRVIERVFGVHGAPLTPDSAVLGVFAVEWALTGRPLWPAERILRTGALRVADRVLDALDASRRPPADAMVPGANPPRNPVPVALDSKVRVPPDVLMQEVDGEAVLLDLRTETYFGLDEVGTLLFRTLKEQGTLGAAVDAGLAAFEVERDELTSDLLALVEDLVAQGLLEVER